MPNPKDDKTSGPPPDRKVLGTFFLDYVRMLKSRKDVNWSKHLTVGDLVFLRQPIVETEWYPMATFERMGLAILAEIAQGMMDLARQWGRAQTDELARRNAESIEGNAHESLVCFQMVRGSYFNFDPIAIRVLSHNHAQLEIAYQMSDLAEQAAAWQTLGYFERLLQLSGATSIDCRFTQRRWDGDPTTTLELDWSNITRNHQVKGVLFLDYARMVKANKQAAWDRWLQPEDVALLAQRIDGSAWYPMASFERMGAGLLNEIAHGDLDQVRVWGRIVVASLIKAHPNLVAPGDAIETLYRFQVLRRSFFNFGAVDINAIHGDYAKLQIDYDMGRATEAAATYETIGFFEKLLETAGAKDLQSTFLSRSWEGDPTTILELRWS